MSVVLDKQRLPSEEHLPHGGFNPTYPRCSAVGSAGSWRRRFLARLPGRPWVGPSCLAPSLPGAPYLRRGGAGRGRRGGAAVPGTSRSSPRDPPRPMAAPQDPLPPGEAGAAGSRAGGRGCPEGPPGVWDRRCAGCGPRLPSRAGQSRGRGSWEPGEECSPGRAGKSF